MSKKQAPKTPPNVTFVVSQEYETWRRLGDRYLAVLTPDERRQVQEYAARLRGEKKGQA